MSTEGRAKWKAYDRTNWPSGPWDTEPDAIQWEHAGYVLMIARQFDGALCGYVGVPKDHPWFGKAHREIRASCHGGLSFDSSMFPDGVTPEPPGLWWVGFHCAHRESERVPLFRDQDPGLPYRDIYFVRQHCESLAEQAARAALGIPALAWIHQIARGEH